MGLRWNRINRALHRDLGYLCLGMTLVYAVSGLALNHRNQWNSSYRIAYSRTTVTPLRHQGPPTAAELDAMLAELGEAEAPLSTFMPEDDTLQLFLEGGRMISVNLPSGSARGEMVSRRPVLFQLNALHLNRGGALWSWLADAYALALVLLALTGVLARTGPGGPRGLYLVAAGILLPLAMTLVLP